MILTTSFNRLQVINPTNDHRADLSACSWYLSAYFSPRYAHKNGPTIIHANPNGPITIPKIGSTITEISNPILLPRTPRLLPPNFFVPRDGII